MQPKKTERITEVRQQEGRGQGLSGTDHAVLPYQQAEPNLPSADRDTSGSAHVSNFQAFLEKMGCWCGTKSIREDIRLEAIEDAIQQLPSLEEQLASRENTLVVTDRVNAPHEIQQQQSYEEDSHRDEYREDETGSISEQRKDSYEVPKSPIKIKKPYYTPEDGRKLLLKAEDSIKTYEDTTDRFNERYTPKKPLKKMNSLDGTPLLHLVDGDPFPG